MPQSTSGHGHNNTAPHVGPHAHNLAVQSPGPTVVQGHVHPPTQMTSTQGQQQFQRLKVPSMNKHCVLCFNGIPNETSVTSQ